MPAFTRRALLAALSALAVAPHGLLRAQGAPAWRLAADFEPAEAIWLGYDGGHADLSAALVRLLRPHVRLKMAVAPGALAPAREGLAARGTDPEGIAFVTDPHAGYFMRDLALFARGERGGLALLDFVWSQYGLAGWCAQRHADDARAARDCAAGDDAPADDLARSLARSGALPLLGSDLAFEGGGIEVNGEGLVLVSETYLRQRNPGRTRAWLEQALLDLPGVDKVIWLADGLAEDTQLRGTIVGDYVAWGTGGHADHFVRFADPRTVLLAWPDPSDPHPVARLNVQRMKENKRRLAAATDAKGRPLNVLRVPLPRIVERPVVLSEEADGLWSEQWTPAWFAPQEGRRPGQRLIQVAPASYLNFVVANGIVVVPDYTPHGTPAGVQAWVRRIFQRAFPGRQIAFVDCLGANWYGGGPHCATLNEPAAAAS
jgi:agmatine deiminase